jgi:hypothetical protein
VDAAARERYDPVPHPAQHSIESDDKAALPGRHRLPLGQERLDRPRQRVGLRRRVALRSWHPFSFLARFIRAGMFT